MLIGAFSEIHRHAAESKVLIFPVLQNQQFCCFYISRINSFVVSRFAESTVLLFLDWPARRDRETERQRGRDTETQRHRDTETQRDRETERQRDISFGRWDPVVTALQKIKKINSLRIPVVDITPRYMALLARKSGTQP